jgi:membrane protein
LHLIAVHWSSLRRGLVNTYLGLLENHTFLVAAGVAYRFALCVFPALILFLALVASLPLPDLFGPLSRAMFSLLPAETARSLEIILLDALKSNHAVWLSIGTLGTVWVLATTFGSLIEALDLAYEVSKERSFWKNLVVSLLLAVVMAGLLLFALASALAQPLLGEWLIRRMYLTREALMMWPPIRWAASFCFALITVELIYFLAPNVKQRFSATLPGALLTVLCWVGLSHLLGFYFYHVADFGATYGTLGGFAVLMTWLYWNLLVLLIGAELNAELAKVSRKGPILQADFSPDLEDVA